MTSKSTNRRRNVLVDPRFQLSFLTHVIALGLIIVWVIYGANTLFFWKMDAAGKSLGFAPDHVFYQFLNAQKKVMNQVFLFVSGVVSVCVTLFGLYYSHRIAGPIYNLKKYFKDLKGEKPKRAVKFRERDYFPELAESVNVHFQNRTQDTRNEKEAGK